MFEHPHRRGHRAGLGLKPKGVGPRGGEAKEGERGPEDGEGGVGGGRHALGGRGDGVI
jgi:hypothetical protein